MLTSKVSIITVGMNHLSYLKNLLASVFDDNNISIPVEMVYVDNCSIDGSVLHKKQISSSQDITKCQTFRI